MSLPKTTIPGITRAPRTIAIDTTFVLCANSALFPAGKAKLQDRDCNDALANLLTYLCNRRQIAYIRPGNTVVRETVPLLTIVGSDAINAEPVPLNPVFDEDHLHNAARDFAAYLSQSGARDVHSWVRFQFADDKYARIFFEGNGTTSLETQVKRLEAAVKALERADQIRSAERKWKEIGASEVSLPDLHADAARLIGIKPVLYSLAYACFGFAKGQTYVLQLPDDVRSCEHWLRAEAGSRLRQRLNETLDCSGTDPVPDGVCFNWGYYLPAFFVHCPEFRTEEGLATVVATARRETTATAIVDILAAGNRRSNEDCSAAITAAANRFASEVLAKAGWTPPYRDPDKFWARSAAAVGGAIGVGAAVSQEVLGGLAGIGVECSAILACAWTSYVYATMPDWYTKIELRLRRFTRASLRADFDVDQIARWAAESNGK